MEGRPHTTTEAARMSPQIGIWIAYYEVGNMSRSADYSIQGFLYQFNKTVLEILKAQDDETITIEGIVEDIEITSFEALTAIQCKYHEASTGFAPSAVYEPLLKMLNHFSSNPTANIHYIIFAHFPGVGENLPNVESVVMAALKSTDKTLKGLIGGINSDVDLSLFASRCTLEFGSSYDDITNDVKAALKISGFHSSEVDSLAYPNAIHMIATRSVKHTPGHRQITKAQFLSELNSIRKTAISRWTLALKTRDKVLQARRKQLKFHLDKNARLRCFVIDPSAIEDYENEIVHFIRDYVDKYHFKLAHIDTPILCICANRDQIQVLQHRLYAKGLSVTDGYVGTHFEASYFFREPLVVKEANNKIKQEFALRLLSWPAHFEELNKRKCDDVFIFGEPDCGSLETNDVNIERLEGVTIKEIRYVMGISNVYE